MLSRCLLQLGARFLPGCRVQVAIRWCHSCCVPDLCDSAWAQAPALHAGLLHVPPPPAIPRMQSGMVCCHHHVVPNCFSCVRACQGLLCMRGLWLRPHLRGFGHVGIVQSLRLSLVCAWGLIPRCPPQHIHVSCGITNQLRAVVVCQLGGIEPQDHGRQASMLQSAPVRATGQSQRGRCAMAFAACQRRSYPRPRPRAPHGGLPAPLPPVGLC